MTTRKISENTIYPFVPVPYSAGQEMTSGILDVYFVIQGRPDGLRTDDSSSSAVEDHTTPLRATVHLVSVLPMPVILPTVTYLFFEAELYGSLWTIVFCVPNQGNTAPANQAITTAVNIGPVTIGTTDYPGTEATGVLVYDAGRIWNTTALVGRQQVEPGRVHWHTEIVKSLTFQNIERCRGVENPAVVNDVFSTRQPSASSIADISLSFEDGYNVVVACSSSSLEFIGGVGLGKGIAPDFGNTGSSCSSGQEIDYLKDVVTTINGIVPVSGNIPLQTSPLIGLQRTTGRIELVVKQ